MSTGSTKPKGATSYKQTSFGILPRSKLLELEVEGTKKGLEYLEHLIDNGKDTKLTPILINKLHEVAFGWIFPDWAGKFRIVQVTFSDKEAPPYYQIPELISNFCKDTEERYSHLSSHDTEKFIVEVVAFLSWFQHKFVFIHPFNDYNGRTARMLTVFLLLRLRLPPFEIQAETEEDRKQYLHAMQTADEGDFSLLEKLISKSLSESLEAAR